MKIYQKILLYLLSTAVFIFGITLTIISYNARNIALEDAKSLTNELVKEYAAQVKSGIDADIFICRTVEQIFRGYDQIPRKVREPIYLAIQKNILKSYPEFVSFGTSWELSAIDSTYEKTYGRFLDGYFREGGEIKYFQKFVNMEGDKIGSNYYKMKKAGSDLVVDPEYYSYTGRSEDEILNSNISVPIMKNFKFCGVVGIDVDLTKFQNIIDKIKPFPGSYAYIIANNCTYVAHPDKNKITKSIIQDNQAENVEYKIEDKIKNGEYFSYFTKNSTGSEVYTSYAPIYFDKISNPWSLGMVIPINEIMSRANRMLYISIVVGIIGLILLGLVIWRMSLNITMPLIKSSAVLEEVAKGKIDTKLKLQIESKDEMGQIAKSVNALIEGLESTTQFANQIGSGDLESEFTLLGEGDVLGNSLLEMRKKLQQARDDAKQRQSEDEKINWATLGFAQFSEILRANNDNLKEFAFNIIHNLVNYVKANQGGLFLISDNDTSDVHIELMASFAYNQRKFIDKRMELGIGLIGRCIDERQMIYMTEIPENYIKITSGLGESKPRNLLLTPLIHNDEIFGVIELASFYEIEPYQKDFILRLCESIASAISTVKVNLRTAKLLQETKMYSDEIAIREELLKNNIEELKSTQEDMQRSQEKINIQLHAINSSLGTIVYDTKGIIIEANELMCSILGYAMEEIKGVLHSNLCEKHYVASEAYKDFWEDLNHGIQKVGDFLYITKSGKRIMLNSGFTPTYNESGKLVNIIQYSNEITRITNTLLDYQAQVEAIGELALIAEYDLKGIITKINQKFLDLTEFTEYELLGKPQSILLEEKYRQSGEYDELWKNLAIGMKLPEQQLTIITHKRDEIVLNVLYYPINDINGLTQKIYSLMTLKDYKNTTA